jgi:YD repeat-containing protein
VGSKDPLGNRSTSVYDTAGRVVASINPLGKRTTTVYNIASQTLATVDANSNRVSSVYDALGRRTVEINALGNRTTTVYNSLGQTSARSTVARHRPMMPPDSKTSASTLAATERLMRTARWVSWPAENTRTAAERPSVTISSAIAP